MENRRTLEGIKVVDLSTFVAAPVCARMLADLGAEVVKIEAFGGDPWRFTARANTNTEDDELPGFDVYNAGKKSIKLNIKHPDGMKILLDMMANADVFITNTRLASLKKLGLDYESVKDRFPRLIYASITGYGDKGPDANSPGFDNVAFWTRSGFMIDMAIKSEGSYPVCSPTGAGDTFTGTVLMGGILAALYQREKTGKGDFVTAALQNAGIWMFAGSILQAQEKYGAKFPKERCDVSPLAASYKCADGEWFGITILDFARYSNPCFEILGIKDELNITSFKDMVSRKPQVVATMERAFLKKTSVEWLKLFKEADIVCGILNHMRDVVKDESALANEFVQEYTCRNGEVCMLPCPPLRMASQPLPKSYCAPFPGEDTVEVLERMGYSAQDIDRLMADGAVQ